MLAVGNAGAAESSRCNTKPASPQSLMHSTDERSEAYLDEVLALGFGDQRLELRCGEGVHKSSLRHDQKQDLGACENGQLVGLQQQKKTELVFERVILTNGEPPASGALMGESDAAERYTIVVFLFCEGLVWTR